MSDGGQKLVKMASQIAEFFRSYPEELAVVEIANHINKFWTRRMRNDFLAASGRQDGVVDPLLAEAAKTVRPG